MRSIRRWLSFVVLASCGWAALAQTAAEGQWPGRVGRLVEVQGTAWVYDRDDSAWVQAEHNRPVAGGERIGTDRGSRIELRIGSTVVRLGGETDIALRRLDERAIAIELLAGSIALRVTAPEVASQIEIATGEGRFAAGTAGHFRIDRRGEASEGTAWRGTLHFEGRDSRLAIATGQRAEFWLEGTQPATHFRWLAVEQDEFAAWAIADDRDADRFDPPRNVSPEMTGWEDLDRYGRWRWHPEHGRVWYPYEVPAGWAPYTLGRWTWIAPWGWTWIDVAPWGFAPFHYGRWVTWGGRWVWTPGPRGARPVFMPAAVDWVFPPYVPGRRPPPPSHWQPLPPRKDFRPHPHPQPVPRDHGAVPPPPRHDRTRPPRSPATSPAAEVPYTPRGVPDGVVRTPRDVFAQPPGGASQPLRAPVPAQPSPGRPSPPVGEPRPQPRPEPPPGTSRPIPAPYPGPVMGGGTVSVPSAPTAAVPAAPGATAPAGTTTSPQVPRPGLGPMSPPPPAAPAAPVTTPRAAAPPPATAPAVAPAVGAAPRPPAAQRDERARRPDRGERAAPEPVDKPDEKPAQEAEGRKRAPEQGGGRNPRQVQK